MAVMPRAVTSWVAMTAAIATETIAATGMTDATRTDRTDPAVARPRGRAQGHGQMTAPVTPPPRIARAVTAATMTMTAETTAETTAGMTAEMTAEMMQGTIGETIAAIRVAAAVAGGIADQSRLRCRAVLPAKNQSLLLPLLLRRLLLIPQLPLRRRLSQPNKRLPHKLGLLPSRNAMAHSRPLLAWHSSALQT
ncbi:hypothetical protein BC831DRAFT_135731 [Entophlyctis helioformis]|nr:hypothetical protein BC831DRAFT_135731 [Entophlyctis helioformis]